ncbi:hypothetical protein UP09_34625 [Bradyrhizobium sp. LTSP885]|nr:hypothetical protein UP09_34625 [Bradyrhizobium sp. LTSP885]
MRDYPIYSPPFHDSELVLAKREIETNYEYFLENKALRLEYLAKYLRTFSVELRFSAEVLSILDAWVYRYGGHLVPAGGDTISALADYEPAWAGKYLGLNVVNDIAIFAGDYIVSKNLRTRWDVWFGDGTQRDYEKQGFGQPCLFGLSHVSRQGPHSVLWEIYRFCDASRFRILHGNVVVSPSHMPNAMLRVLTHLADPGAPPPVSVSYAYLDDPNFVIDD